jgi:hypothetical protein
VSGELHTVHLRINDAATGQPTPVRLRVTGPDGKYYAPFGRLTQFATGWGQDVGGNLMLDGKAYAYIDGACEIALPAGRLLVEATKGPEFVPVRQEVDLTPGKLALRFNVERWIDLRKEGWHSGDCRAHFLTPHAALLEGAAEDLAIVNLLIEECRLPSFDEETDAFRGLAPAIPNIVAFSGQRPVLEIPGHLVAANSHNRHALLGSVSLLNCHRPVYPLRCDDAEGWDDWTLADWCDQCHRKGGLVIWTETDWSNYRYGERFADLVLGKIDALELDLPGGPGEGELYDQSGVWQECLNSGFRIPLVGSSGKYSNSQVLGSVRTYAQTGSDEQLTYGKWIEAIRAGRTVVTSGPLIRFTVNGLPPGSTVHLTENATLHVRADVHSPVAYEYLEIVSGGEVVKSVNPNVHTDEAHLEFELALSASTWLAARCRGRAQAQPDSLKWLALTSPVYVEHARRPPRPTVRFLNWFRIYLATMRDRGHTAEHRQAARLARILDAAEAAVAERCR